MASCPCIFISIINFIFGIFGLAVLAVGILLKTKSDLISEHVVPLLKTSLDKAANSSDVFDRICIGFIIIGVCVIGLCILGIIGAVCEIQECLIAYVILISAIMIIEIVGSILLVVYMGTVKLTLKDILKNNIKDKYQGDQMDADALNTMAWNYVFSTFECCGIDDYTDLHAAEKWDRRTDQQIPFSCCMYSDVENNTCTTNPTPENSYLRGCYKVLAEYLKKPINIFIAVGGTLGFIQMVTLVLACVLCYRRYREKNSHLIV